jgi:hypothetical protein
MGGNTGSHGAEEGLWELAVLKWGDSTIKYGEMYKIVYDTPITDDVLGYLTETGVEKTLDDIKEMEMMENENYKRN